MKGWFKKSSQGAAEREKWEVQMISEADTRKG